MSVTSKDENALTKVYRYFICPACAYFTVIVFLSTLFYNLISETSSNALSVQNLIWFWIFSMAMSGLNFIFRIKVLNTALKILIHWMGFILLFIVVFLFMSSEMGMGAMIFAVLLTVVYFIFAGLLLLFRKIFKPLAIRRFFLPVCVYFTCAVFLSVILCYSIEVADGAPTFINQCWFWIFAVAMALLENLFRTGMSMFFRVLLHYLGFLASTILVFFVLAHNYVDFMDAFIASVVLSVIYFFVAAIVLMINGAFKQTENKEKKYKRQFNG